MISFQVKCSVFFDKFPFYQEFMPKCWGLILNRTLLAMIFLSNWLITERLWAISNMIVNNFYYQIIVKMSGLNSHYKNLLQEKDLHQRVTNMREIQRYVEILLKELDKANQEVNVLRQRLQESEDKLVRIEDTCGDQMRFVFMEHNQIVADKNQTISHLLNLADKEQTASNEWRSEVEILKKKEQQLITQYEEALMIYRNKLLEAEHDIKIVVCSLDQEKEASRKTIETYNHEIQQLKLVLRENDFRLSELSDRNQQAEKDNQILLEYTKNIQSDFVYKEQELNHTICKLKDTNNSLVYKEQDLNHLVSRLEETINALKINLKRQEQEYSLVTRDLQSTIQNIRRDLQQQKNQNYELQTVNRDYLRQIEDKSQLVAHLTSQNEGYVADNERLVFLLEQSNKENAFLRSRVHEIEQYTYLEIEQRKHLTNRLEDENQKLRDINSDRQVVFSAKAAENKQLININNCLQLNLSNHENQLNVIKSELKDLQLQLVNQKQKAIDLQSKNRALTETIDMFKQQNSNVNQINLKIKRENSQLITQNHNLSRLLANPRQLNKDYVDQIDRMLKNFHEEREQQNKRHWLQKQKLKEMYEYERKQKQLQFLRRVSMLQDELNRARKMDILVERSGNLHTNRSKK